jgi:hypothetical protein
MFRNLEVNSSVIKLLAIFLTFALSFFCKSNKVIQDFAFLDNISLKLLVLHFLNKTYAPSVNSYIYHSKKSYVMYIYIYNFFFSLQLLPPKKKGI